MEETHRMPANPFGLLLRQVRNLVPCEEDRDAVLLARFINRRDEDAFAALVRRHGPLVLGLCRRWLGNLHDAEDVFQATFLVLARRAASIRKRQSLASFLHGIALRLAARARTEAARRRRPFLATELVDNPDPLQHLSASELRQALDDELDLLSERYRAPLVLCYLQGRTQDEAARELGWSKGTLRRRLSRGRDLLRARLTGRGLSLGSFLGVPLGAGTLAQVSTALWTTTVQTALTGRISSPTVAALAEAGIKALAPARLRVALTFLLATGMFALTCGMVGEDSQPAATPPVAAALPLGKSEALPEAAPWVDDPLPDGAVARLGTRRGRPKTSVLAMTFTPDGKTLATCGYEGCIRLWDPATGHVVRTISKEHIDQMEGLSLSRDGKSLATLARWHRPGPWPNTVQVSHSVEVWDLATGQTTASVANASPLQAALSPDGKTVAYVEYPNGKLYVRLHDLALRRTRTVPVTIDLYVLQVNHGEMADRFLAYSPDGRFLALGSRFDSYRILSSPFGGMLGRGTSPREEPVGLPVQVWDVQSGKSVLELTGAGGQSSCLAFSPDSKTLATGSFDGKVRLWDLAAGQRRAEIRSAESNVICVAFTPDGQSLLAGSRGKQPQVLAWNLSTGKVRYRALVDPYLLAVSPDSKKLAVLDDDNVLRIFDARTGKAVFSPPGHTSAVHDLAFSPGGKELASAERTGVVLRWDLRTGRPTARYQTPYAPWGCCLAYDGNDHLLIGTDGPLADKNGVILPTQPPTGRGIVDLMTGRMCRRLDKVNTPSFQLSPDGRLALSMRTSLDGNPEPAKRIWDVTTGQRLPDLKDPIAEGVSLAFSPDGTHVAATTGMLKVWNLTTGRVSPCFNPGQAALPSRPGTVFSNVAFSPDNRLLAEFNPRESIPIQTEPNDPPRPHPSDEPIRIFEVATGKEVARLAGHRRVESISLAFSPDGRRLATGSGDCTVRVWDVASGKEVRCFKGHEEWVCRVAFAPDGMTLASSSLDTMILLWDLAALVR
jgi:RNA polymerase sigma factor (sigma-70 family)